MPVESATHINDLVTTNPASSDNVADADNHIRLLKTVLKTSLPDVTAPLTDLDKQPFGQICKGRLEYTNTSTVTLNRFGGKHIFINGSWEEIPSSGPTLAASALASNDTTYFVYAYMVSTTLTLEVSATAPATDTTYGHKIKTGDASRTLVGMVRKTGGSFADTLAYRGVASYYNRRARAFAGATRTAVATSATSASEDTTSKAEFMAWDDEAVSFDIQAYAYGSTNGMSGSIYPYLDSVAWMVGAVNTFGISSYIYNFSQSGTSAVNTNGFHNASLGVLVTTGTMTYSAVVMGITYI